MVTCDKDTSQTGTGALENRCPFWYNTLIHKGTEMTDEQLFDLVKSHFTNEYLKEVHFNLTNESIKLVLVRDPEAEKLAIEAIDNLYENNGENLKKLSKTEQNKKYKETLEIVEKAIMKNYDD